jgi:hypothetical protein
MKMPASVGSTLEDQPAAARAHSQLLEAHFDATIEPVHVRNCERGLVAVAEDLHTARAPAREFGGP